MDKITAGALDTSSKATGTEFGEIIAIGPDVKGFEVGQKLFYKAWQLDAVSYLGETYYFIDSDGQGVCAIVEE